MEKIPIHAKPKKDLRIGVSKINSGGYIQLARAPQTFPCRDRNAEDKKRGECTAAMIDYGCS